MKCLRVKPKSFPLLEIMRDFADLSFGAGRRTAARRIKMSSRTSIRALYCVFK